MTDQQILNQISIVENRLQNFIDRFNSLNDEEKDYAFTEMSKNHLIKKNQAKTIQKCWRKYWRSINDVCVECDKCFDQHREVLCNDDIKHIWLHHQDEGQDEGDLCPDCILKLDYIFGDHCSD